jgi:hypothetical protein
VNKGAPENFDDIYAPPAFAIANGFFIGRFPSDLPDMNETERILLARYIMYQQFTVLYGQKRKIHRSCTLYEANLGIAATILPRLPADQCTAFQVLFQTGKRIGLAEATKHCQTKFNARPQVVKAHFDFKVKHTIGYEHTKFSDEVMHGVVEMQSVAGAFYKVDAEASVKEEFTTHMNNPRPPASEDVAAAEEEEESEEPSPLEEASSKSACYLKAANPHDMNFENLKDQQKLQFQVQAVLCATRQAKRVSQPARRSGGHASPPLPPR